MALLDGASTVASSASDTLVSGLTQVGSDMSGMITKVLPIALGIVAVLLFLGIVIGAVFALILSRYMKNGNS